MRDEAEDALVAAVMRAAKWSGVDKVLWGRAAEIVDALFSPSLAEARAAMEEPTGPIGPGSLIRHTKTGDEVYVLRRKTGADAVPFPGWWLTDGSGIADFVLARGWQLVAAPDEGEEG